MKFLILLILSSTVVTSFLFSQQAGDITWGSSMGLGGAIFQEPIVGGRLVTLNGNHISGDVEVNEHGMIYGTFNGSLDGLTGQSVAIEVYDNNGGSAKIYSTRWASISSSAPPSPSANNNFTIGSNDNESTVVIIDDSMGLTTEAGGFSSSLGITFRSIEGDVVDPNQNTNASQTIIISSIAFIDNGDVVNDSELSSNISGYFEILDNEITKYNLHVYGTHYSNLQGDPNDIILIKHTNANNSGYIDDGKEVKRVRNYIEYDTFRVENGVLIFSSDIKFISFEEILLYDGYENSDGSVDWVLDSNFDPTGTQTTFDFFSGYSFTANRTPYYNNYGNSVTLYDDYSSSYYGITENIVLELAFFSEDSDTSNLGTDSDSDGLYDYHETGTGIYVSKQNTGSDPNDIDSDDDGITDGIEVNQYNTNPNLVDSDGDTLNDGAELFTHNTNPNLADTNSDGINDDISLEYSIDPNGDYSNIINYISTNPENLNLYTQIQVTSAEANARTQGREEVKSSPSDYGLFSQADFNSMVAERDARPTQADYDSMVAERDARPTQAVYDAVSQELVALENRVFDVLPKLIPPSPIFDYTIASDYLFEAKREIDNSRDYNLIYNSIDSDILLLENAINQSDLESANSLLDDIISYIDNSNLSIKVLYDFTIARANFELAKIYISIGDLVNSSNRINEAKHEIENSRSFDTTYQSIDSGVSILENALLQEDLDTAYDALEDIIDDLDYPEFASNIEYDFSIAKSKFQIIIGDISTYRQYLDDYDPTPVPSETLENYIIGLNQEIEDAQIIIDQKFYVDEFKDLRPGSTMIGVSGNQATVQLQMEESSDLQTWEDTGTTATMTIPADTDTKFFRFKMAE